MSLYYWAGSTSNGDNDRYRQLASRRRHRLDRRRLARLRPRVRRPRARSSVSASRSMSLFESAVRAYVNLILNPVALRRGRRIDFVARRRDA